MSDSISCQIVNTSYLDMWPSHFCFSVFKCLYWFFENLIQQVLIILNLSYKSCPPFPMYPSLCYFFFIPSRKFSASEIFKDV